MLRQTAQRVVRKALTQSKRSMGGSALHGEATSPHYADFGYGANQMLPFHEVLKNPIPFKYVAPKPYPHMVAGHHPELHQHQQFSSATGHSFSIVPGIDPHAEKAARERSAATITGIVGMASIFSGLIAYEHFMWGGFQFIQQPLWDEMVEVSLRSAAHQLQWERPYREMMTPDFPMSEVYEIIENRPFYTKNPYRFSIEDLKIADKNVSYRAFEPALQKLSPEEYRSRANYIMFYSELQEKIAEIARDGKAQQFEEELSNWLFTQNKYSKAELDEIMAVAPQYNANFEFHKNAVYDQDKHEIVYFPGRHWAVAEENTKAPVQSFAETAGSKATVALVEAEPLLVELLKRGPAITLRDTFVYKIDQDDNSQAQRAALWNFIVMDASDAQRNAYNQLLKLQKSTLSSGGDLSAFKASAQASGLPVPTGFSISAINHAIAKANLTPSKPAAKTAETAAV